MSETITLDGTEFVCRKGKWYEQSAEEDTPAGGWVIVPDSLFFRALDALATETARREKAEAERDAMVKIAGEAFKHWDADRDSKAGKLLCALAGRRGIRVDLDRIRDTPLDTPCPVT